MSSEKKEILELVQILPGSVTTADVMEELYFKQQVDKGGVEEILNLQPKGAKAKPYQVKGVRNVILRYKLGGKEDD